MRFKICMAATAKELRECRPSVTVEAEYGADVVLGELATLAHHVFPFLWEKCPCLREEREFVALESDIEVIGVSHIDLDTVGGIAAAVGLKSGPAEFWQLAALVDVTGPHNPEVRNHQHYPSLLAYWAWAQMPENRAPRMKEGDGLKDVASLVRRHLAILFDIFREWEYGAGVNGSLHQAGAAMAAAEEKLNADSFLYCAMTPAGLTVALRKADTFVNHLYNVPGGVAQAVLAHNTQNNSLTLSFRDNASRGNRDAADIMRRVFGPEAGGHPNIAGTPRGSVYNEENMMDVVLAL